MRAAIAAAVNDWVHLLHIVASMIWVGGLVTLGALAFETRRRRRTDEVARLVGSLRLIGPAVLAPGPLLLLASGIWSVADSDAWSFAQTWVWLGLLLLGAAFLFGAAVQSRTAIRAERAAVGGNEREALRELRRWAWGSVLILLILFLATWDMVFKPGL